MIIKRRFLGVTLIEMIVAIAVFAIGMGTIFTVFPSGFAVAQKNKSLSTAYALAAACLEMCRQYDMFGGSCYDSSGSTYGLTDRKMFGCQKAPFTTDSRGQLLNTNGEFKQCDKIFKFSGTTPESYYFYSTYYVPVVDLNRIYAEYPHKRVGADIRGINKNPYPQTSASCGHTACNNSKWEGFASMYRITCVVRGPYPPGTKASDVKDESFDKTSGPVEAILSTMIANDRLGDALLAEEKIVRQDIPQRDSDYDDRLESLGKPYIYEYAPDADGDGLSNCPENFFIRIKKLVGRVRPEDFTCFLPGALNYLELADTGPTIVGGDMRPDDTIQLYNTATQNELVSKREYAQYIEDEFGSTYTKGLEYYDNVFDASGPYAYSNKVKLHTENQIQINGSNILGLDNVVIYCPKYDQTGTTEHYAHELCSYENGGWVAESNKIIRMYPPNSAGNNSEHWRFDLLNALIARDTDFTVSNPGALESTSRYADYNRDRYRQGLLMDKVFDGDSIVMHNGSRHAGYPVGNKNGNLIRGTRVRSLVTINGGRMGANGELGVKFYDCNKDPNVLVTDGTSY